MRLLNLKTQRLALIFAIVALVLHLAVGYLLAAVIKNPTLASTWQSSLKIYWPAMSLIQVFTLNVNVGYVFGLVTMILTALLELWAIFAAGIWLIRLNFRNPPISNVSRVGITVTALVFAVCFYTMSPEALGDPRSPLERAMESGDTNAVAKILASNPALANKPFRFGN